jgi:peroxin-3
MIRTISFSDALFPPPSSPEELETLSSGGIASSDLFISAPLRHLLNETSDFLESADGNKIRSLCLDRLISTFEASLENVFSRGVASPAASLLLERSEVGGEMMRFEDVGELRIRLASLLPKLARGSHLVMNGMPNEYVEVSTFSF